MNECFGGVDFSLNQEGCQYAVHASIDHLERIFISVSTSLFTERWSALFTPQFIAEMTERAGTRLKSPVVWSILQHLTSPEEHKLEAAVIDSKRAREIIPSSTSDRVFFVVSRTTSFTRERYVFPLDNHPLTSEEKRSLILRLYHRNENLQTLQNEEKIKFKNVKALKKQLAQRNKEIQRLKRELFLSSRSKIR